MKTHRINEMSWTEFNRRRKETDIAIIPTGACEIYGPHLPMGADLFAAEGVADMVARRTGALIAPAVPLADSSMLLDYPGTLTLSPELYRMWIRELTDNLVGYGFKKMLFINGHATNSNLIQSIAVQHQLTEGVQFAQIDWWRFTAQHDEGILDTKGRMAHGHASECGTSVMLYFRPELVDMDKAMCVPPITPDFQDITYFIPLREKTPNAIVGDATLGTAEKGERLVCRCVDRIVAFMVQKWEAQDLGEQ